MTKNSLSRPLPTTTALVALISAAKAQPMAAVGKRFTLSFMALITFTALAVLAAVAGVGFNQSHVPYIATGFQIVGTLIMIMFMAALLIELIRGFSGMTDDLDRTIHQEEQIINSVADCCRHLLTERGERLIVESKILVRRVSAAGLVTGLGIAVLQLHSAGISSAMWTAATQLPLLIAAGSFGVLVGALALIDHTSRLDRAGELLITAAKRQAAKAAQIAA